MVLELSKKHFDILQLKVDYFDFKKKFFQFIDLLKADILKANKSTTQDLISFYSNEELLLNQPLSFKNNPNLMYYSLLTYLLPSLNDPIKRFENIITKHNIICILDEYLKKIEHLTDVQIWNIIFYIISITEEKFVLDLQEKLEKKEKENEFSIICGGETIQCEIKMKSYLDIKIKIKMKLLEFHALIFLILN